MPHADTLCGWLLPGPVSIAPLPPRLTAICAAVIELPYRFETLPLTVAAATLFAPTGEHVAAPVVPPTEQCVHMVEFVLLLGLTPACVLSELDAWVLAACDAWTLAACDAWTLAECDA